MTSVLFVVPEDSNLEKNERRKFSLGDSILREFGSTNNMDIPKADQVKKAVVNYRITQIDGVPGKIDGIDYLFLGSIGSAYNLKELQNAGMTHILCLSSDIQLKYPDQFTYKRADISDRVEYDISEHFSDCIQFILAAKDSGGKCLVHCYQGKSRYVFYIRSLHISQYSRLPKIMFGFRSNRRRRFY